MSTYARPVTYGPSSAANYSGDRRFGGAFWVSVSLHGSVVVLALLTMITLRDKDKLPPQVFELVAGDGNAYDATEATQGVESPAPQMSLPTINSVKEWTPPTPVEPVEPVAPTPVEVTPVAPVTPVAKPIPIPNFKQQISSTKRKEERKADREIKQERAEAAKLEKATYDQFKKEHGVKTTATQRTTAPTTGPRLDPNAARRGLENAKSTGPGAGGPAATANTGAAMDRYFALLIQRLRANHEKPGGLSDLLSAEVEFTLAANGALTGARIIRSSGNADFDASVLETFARVRSIGTRPDGKTGTHKLTFRMKEV